MLTVIGGVVVILLYTEWTWLDTNVSRLFHPYSQHTLDLYYFVWQNLYVSYEVLGIISLAAVVVNVSNTQQ